MKKSKTVSIHKIAEIADVSAMTVTRALNGSGSVSAKTKAKVSKVAAELGYRTNVLAQGLRSGRTNSIGLLWGLSGPHDSLGLVCNISLTAMQKGYTCNIANSLSDLEITRKCLNDFCSRSIDGIIIELENDLINNPEIRSLLREISNVVMVVRQSFDSEFDTIILDRTKAMRDLATHFMQTGRKRIVFLASPSLARECAFIEQLKSYGLACSEDSVIHIPKYPDPKKKLESLGDLFVDAIRQKFKKKMPFDAIICSCDEGAVAVINYLREIGYKVPQDIAVSGYNNNIMSPHFTPPLASVDRLNGELAESVTEMLFNRLANPDLPPQRKLLEMKFIPRESAG